MKNMTTMSAWVRFEVKIVKHTLMPGGNMKNIVKNDLDSISI